MTNDGVTTQFKLFLKFIIARHAVYMAREVGQPRPWLTDPILQLE